MYCKECGKELDEKSKFCSECGIEINNNESSISENSAKNESENEEGLLLEINSGWIAVAILLPFIGVIGGIYYAIKGKRGAGRLLFASIIIWIILAFIFIMAGI